MRTFTTEEIAKATGGVASGHAEVTSVVIDNREARPGSLFIAIKGERLDGHQFIDSAVEAGATAVLCHKDVSCKVPTVKVADTTKAFLDQCGEDHDQRDDLVCPEREVPRTQDL